MFRAPALLCLGLCACAGAATGPDEATAADTGPFTLLREDACTAVIGTTVGEEIARSETDGWSGDMGQLRIPQVFTSEADMLAWWGQGAGFVPPPSQDFETNSVVGVIAGISHGCGEGTEMTGAWSAADGSGDTVVALHTIDRCATCDDVMILGQLWSVPRGEVRACLVTESCPR
jgi:hypothetical protein